MTTLALVHPSGLVATELRELLEQRSESWDELRLLSSAKDETGVLTSVGDTAAVVQPFEPDRLEGVDVAFFDGLIEANRPLFTDLPPATVAVVLSSDAQLEDGYPVVAGVNTESVADSPRLTSPHPGVVGLAHLLHPLLPYEPYRITAMLLEPVSAVGSGGLDEMLAQARSLLTFQPQTPPDVLPAQMAFNVLPGAATPPAAPGEQLSSLLGSDLELTLTTLRIGVFHGYGFSLHIELDEDPGVDAIRGALGAHTVNEMVDEPELLGPVDAAGRNRVLVGPITQDPNRHGGYHIWAVMDHLTCGGAGNAMAILDALKTI